MVDGVAQNVAQVPARLVEQVWIVDREPTLRVTEDEHVGEPVHVHAVDGLHAFGPVGREGDVVGSGHVVSSSAGVLGADLESGGVDEAVELVFGLADHHGGGCEPIDALAVGVDQGDVGPVEGLQVLVVETGALAELAVPGFERLGGGGIGDELVDPAADLFHLLEVGQFEDGSQVGRWLARGVPVLHPGQQLADDVRPAVHHQVLGRHAA